MEKLFSPESMVLFGLSSNEKNIPKLILDNLIRWGYNGKIYGVHPKGEDFHVNGITIYQNVSDLPETPDLGVVLVPAKYAPDIVKGCGEKGIKRLALLSGGFNELGEEGEQLAQKVKDLSKQYGIRFIGPNCIGVANTENGLCLPFVPLLNPGRGGFSLISQSGGLGIFQWNMIKNESLGIAKFASIGNKLDVSEIEVLEYFGRDPETKIIGMYLESIQDGKALIKAAEKIDKPILIYKANRTDAGHKAAMSHTASLSNDDEIVDAAFERAGIIRVNRFDEFINLAKAFEMPPMRGDKIMIMSPAGGFAVIMSDICEEEGFKLADPGRDFYDRLSKMGNAGIIEFKNPLDMGDIYNMGFYGDIFHTVLHSEGVDGAVFLSQWPDMPGHGNDIFTSMFNTDLSKEILGSVMSSGKPLGITLFGSRNKIGKIKERIPYPLFDSPEDMIHALKKQSEFYIRQAKNKKMETSHISLNFDYADKWIAEHEGDIGEEFLDVLEKTGIEVAKNKAFSDPSDATAFASRSGYPVVMKVISKDALHKSDVGGVLVGLKSDDEVKKGYEIVKNNLLTALPDADFDGVRIMEMADLGHDMFIGAKRDPSFGHVIYFGYGGIYIEIFKDVQSIICPSYKDEIIEKIKKLKSYKILSGARGGNKVDIESYADLILKISYFVARYENITELDLNPVRILEDTGRALILDARVKIEK